MLFPCRFLNFTNEYLKILCLQMETSGAAEGGDGLGINGAMFFSNYLFFTILTGM